MPHAGPRLAAGGSGGRCPSSVRAPALPRKWPWQEPTWSLGFAARHYATYLVSSSSWGAPGTDGEVLVARYGEAAVTDADRDAAAAQLREHYAAGRLSLGEFQDRLDA